MRFSFPKNRLFLVVIALVLVGSLNLFENPVRSFFYSISSPFQSALWAGGKGISKQQDTELQEENLSLKAQLAELEDIKKENAELRNALDLGIDKEFMFLRADILAKDIFQDTIVIGQGQKHGLSQGMSVITPSKVLVGKIIEVYDSTAKVMLVSHSESSFDIKLGESGATGLWKGQGKSEGIIDLISKGIAITPGQQILTTRLGGVYPENLLVGEVKELISTDAAPFQTAKAEQLFNFPQAEFVFVITGLK